MSTRPKVLLLDDDPDMLEIYREILQRLPAQPDIQTVTSGTRAIAMLEAEPFSMVITDLSMPKMDGLQVLAVVRRRWPHMKTAVMTSAADDQYRKRAYGMGVDVFCSKPSTSKEIESFLAEIDKLLRRPDEPANATKPGISTLGDALRLEALARNSSVIRCVQGGQEGKVWVQQGEVIDAVAPELTGEAAFDLILSWANARVEILPADPSRPRRIFNAISDTSLFASAPRPSQRQHTPAPQPPPQAPQPAKQEYRGTPSAPQSAPPPSSSFSPPQQPNPPQRTPSPAPQQRMAPPAQQPPQQPPPPKEPAHPPEQAPTRQRSKSGMADLARTDGVDLLLSIRAGDDAPEIDSWGVEHPDELAQWTVATLDRFQSLGETLGVGKSAQVELLTATTRISLILKGDAALCAGFKRSMVPEVAREHLKAIISKWAS